MTTTAGSRWTRVGQRVLDRSRAPRRWWHPPVVYQRLPREVFTEAYKQYAETTNRTMLALIAVGTFCLLTVISTPDKALLAAEGTVKVPFAEASISFLGFVVVAPLLLTVVSVYLHIFYGYWLDLEHERQEYNRILPYVDKTPVEPVPMLFALADPVSRGLTSFIFYWLPPGVLAAIAWKGAAVRLLGPPLLLGFGVVAATLLFLRIRRSPEPRRRLPSMVRWFLLVSVGVYLVYSLHDFKPRRLNLYHADLAGAFLLGQDLRGAILSRANLSGTDLEGANLRGADLLEANLRRANLQGADLQGANLRGADLLEANLRAANFEGADLWGANLVRARAQGANLRGKNLTGHSFESNEDTKLPADYHKPAPSAKP